MLLSPPVHVKCRNSATSFVSSSIAASLWLISPIAQWSRSSSSDSSMCVEGSFHHTSHPHHLRLFTKRFCLLSGLGATKLSAVEVDDDESVLFFAWPRFPESRLNFSYFLTLFSCLNPNRREKSSKAVLNRSTTTSDSLRSHSLVQYSPHMRHPQDWTHDPPE